MGFDCGKEKQIDNLKVCVFTLRKSYNIALGCLSLSLYWRNATDAIVVSTGGSSQGPEGAHDPPGEPYIGSNQNGLS